jgi:hypothetical protein
MTPTWINPDYHYIVDGVQIGSKNQALLMSGGDYSRIHFYNMEHVWDSVDWSEPTEAFDELCVARCRQLREQYDYLCLWLSAGYDSNTILASFIRAGVKIDELAFMNRNYYTDPEMPFVLAAMEDYKKSHNPNVRIQIAEIDYQYTQDLYMQLKENWILEPTDGSLRFSKSIASFIQRFHTGILRNRDNSPVKRADIYGKEKPKLNLYAGNWYLQSNDAAVRDVMAAPIVQFYVSGDMPALHVKQCHMAARYFESLPGVDHDMVHDIQSMNRSYYQTWNLALGRSILASPLSRDATTKTYYTQQPDSWDGRRALTHFQVTGDPVNRYFQAGIDLMKHALPEGSDLHPTILGKQWCIRKFIHAEKIST